MKGVTVADSVTQLGPEARGTVAVCGSHGGMYAAWVAARAGVSAVALNDAGTAATPTVSRASFGSRACEFPPSPSISAARASPTAGTC